MNESNDGGGSRLTRRRLIGAATLGLGAAATAVAVAARDERTLAVGELDGTALFEISVSDGERIVLAYTHSVEKTPIRDVYVVDDDALRMERTEFSSFGAGLPTEGVYRIDDGYAVDHDARYPELVVAPSEVAGHELRVGGERYDLTVAAGSVALTVEPGSFLGTGPLERDMDPHGQSGGGEP